MSQSKRCQRAYTLSELMTVTVILALVFSFVVALIGPLLRAHYQSAAKLDNIESAASAMYQLQRDLRQTVGGQVWACTTGASPVCSQPTSFDPTTSAIAFPTSYTGGRNQFALDHNAGPNYNTPNWQGVMVYWVDSGGSLHWAVDTNPGNGFQTGSSSVPPAAAKQAVTDATATAGTVIANNVQRLLVALPGTASTVSVELQVRSTVNGFVNKTTFQSNVYTRNG